MLDPRMLLDNPKLIVENLQKRQQTGNIEVITKHFTVYKKISQEIDSLRHQSKQISEKIGPLLKANKGKSNAEIEALKKQSQEVKSNLRELEVSQSQHRDGYYQPLLELPNLLDPSVPIGKTAADNVEVRRSDGVSKRLEQGPDHLEIGTRLGIIDCDRASKISGSRFALLRGMGARLEMALIQFMLDLHGNQGGYEPLLPPYLVQEQSMIGTGQLPKFRHESFFLEKDGYFLVPTAEVPITNIHRDEVFAEKDLPLKYVAFTPCFRREAGSYGQDTRGLIRLHQFHKVELVKITTPTTSSNELESLTADAEKTLKILGLPYRVVDLCSGDIGFSAAKCYDIEVWLPGQKQYREISSCSNCGDFQARRINIRYKPESGGKAAFAHTLNGSGLAVGRTLIAILENYWNEDGTVTIPEALRPYLGGRENIGAER